MTSNPTDLIERLDRKINSTGAWMTGDLREFYTAIRNTLTQQEGEIEAVRKIGLNAAENWLECAIEQANDYGEKDAVFDQMMRGIERAEKAVAALSTNTGVINKA